MTDEINGTADIPELTIVLRKAVTLGSISYTELRLREPTAAEWAIFDKLDGVEADIKAVALVSGVPEAAVRMIGARDLIAGGKYLARFLS